MLLLCKQIMRVLLKCAVAVVADVVCADNICCCCTVSLHLMRLGLKFELLINLVFYA